MGFRLLLASGELGWQEGTLYTCEGEPSDATCTSDGGAVKDDPLLTPSPASRSGSATSSRPG